MAAVDDGVSGVPRHRRMHRISPLADAATDDGAWAAAISPGS